MSIQVCRDTSDAVALYLPQRLYLKSFAKLNISVQLPSQKVHGKSISNWELMEKLRKMIQPDSFSLLKVSKLTSELIRFDGELENRDRLERVLQRLDDRVVHLKDYPEALKMKVSEAKTEFPSRHAWDSFFRDATDMDEMKPGERPDTLHIYNLPIRWFVHERDNDEDPLPSESIFKKVFEKFGSVRQVDVPAADPFRMQMKVTMRGITMPPQDSALYFEGYIQFSEYVGFVRCMDALRNRKLVRKKDDLAEWCAIKVDFDKTKHMTDAAVKRRAIVRERLSSRQRAKDEEDRLEKENVAKREARERHKYERAEREKLDKMREREERRKKKQLAKLMERDDVDVNSKVAEEQKKLLKAQKKLQAIRLIEELFKRIELRPELQHGAHDRYGASGDRGARARIVQRVKSQHEQLLASQQERLRHALDGRIVIRSALDTKKPKRDSSLSSVSSIEEKHEKRVKTEKLTTPEREMEYNKTASMYGALPYGYGYPFAAPNPYAFPQTSMYYPMRGAYYPPPDSYMTRRARGRGRGRGRGGVRMPHFEGPDAPQMYYRYFKKLTESEGRNEHDSRHRSYSRSRSRSRRRSYSRSRSRDRSRSRRRSRSRSRSRRSHSRNRRSRSYSRSRSRSRKRSRSRSRRRTKSGSKSRARSPSKSRARSHSKSRARSNSRPRSRSKSKHKTPTTKPAEDIGSNDGSKYVSPNKMTTRERSRSWSLPKDGEQRKSWSKSPKEN